MEPNISATPSSPVADANGRPDVDEPGPALSENGYATAFAAVGHPASLPRTNGHTNGHGAARTNGHHARVAVESPAPAASRWRALAGPVKNGVAGRYMAAPHAVDLAAHDGFYQRIGK